MPSEIADYALLSNCRRGPGLPRRRDRLAVPAAIRLRVGLRRAARRRRARQLAAAPRRAGCRRGAPLRRRHLHARHPLDDPGRRRGGSRRPHDRPAHGRGRRAHRPRAAAGRRVGLGRLHPPAADAAGLCPRPALGAAARHARRARTRRDRRARQPRAARGEVRARGPFPPRSGDGRRRGGARHRADVASVPPRAAAAPGRRGRPRPHPHVVDGVGRPYRRARGPPRRSGAVAADPAGAHPSRHGRHHRRRDHLAAGAVRR